MNRKPLSKLATIIFTLAAGSLTTVGGAMIARYVFHMRIMWDTTLASVCMALVWLLIALLLLFAQKIMDRLQQRNAGKSEPSEVSHRRH
ncbi:hypothetical protein [Bifidobacterium sp. SO1]|uniref:hypothetical protein n=1 Tax=Bifidobacterium sp. SO1 TaxID=2809029 RepID=UPI001BDDB3C1|nr:hypothetical protein [Bifidobacterium sp. SO1]MBT1162183.1 hypothetical protein [Bifidobacterium sp. SO1]